MNCRCAAVGLSLLGLWLVPGTAVCVEFGARPLQLGLASAPVASAHDSTSEGLRPLNTRIHRPAVRRTPAIAPVEPSLAHRALQGVIDPPERMVEQTSIGSSQPSVQFRFKRRGPALRDLSASYKNMCENLSEKIWDEPNGRRVKFDIAGKPGVAVVIPIR